MFLIKERKTNKKYACKVFSKSKMLTDTASKVSLISLKHIRMFYEMK